MKRTLLSAFVLLVAFVLSRAQSVPAPEQAFICTMSGTNTNARILFSTNMVNWTVVAQIKSPGPWAISITETNPQGFFMCDTNVCIP